MSSISEDAMFKALLRNKPQQNTQTVQKTEVQARREIKPTVPKPGSEDAMFQVLLKNRPQQQITKSVQNPQQDVSETKESAPEPQVSAMPGLDGSENKNQVIEPVSPAVNSMQAEAVIESLKDLTASVNMVHSLMKSLIAPVLVLILAVGIVILVKGII